MIEDTQDERIKIYQLADGTSYEISVKDRYALWSVRRPAGPTPAALKNQKFTSLLEAEKAIDLYEANKPKGK